MSQVGDRTNFDEGNYAVIAFEDESSTVEAVPRKWLNTNKTNCWWPPKSRTKNISNLIKLEAEPNPDSWDFFEINVLKMYDDYNSAKKKVDRIVKELSSTSDEECLGRGRRIKIKHVNENEPTMEIPIIPITYGNRSPAISLVSSNADSNANNHSSLAEADIVGKVISNCSTVTSVSTISLPNIDNIHQYVAPPVPTATLSDIHTSVQTGFVEMMRELVCIQEKLDQNTARIVQLETRFNLNNISSPSTPDIVDVGSDLGLPLDTIEALKGFEAHLSEELFRKSFQNEMQLLRGGKPPEFIRRMLSKTFTNNLAVMSSWTGIRGSLEVKSTKTITIIEHVTRSIHPNIAKKDVKDTVALWFRNGNQRIKRDMIKNKEHDS